MINSLFLNLIARIKKRIGIILYILLALVIIVFAFSLFKNIQYPLMWGDEADTAMFAERVLDYGYPKVHDGKNSLNYAMISGNVGVNEKYDANTVSMWGQYYFTTIGAALARTTNDIYIKTAMLRIPHAIIGLIGILLLPFVLTPSIKNSKKRILLWIGYLLLVIFSVSLILHIKEVRSYSLSIFFSSIFLVIFTHYYFYKSLNRLAYYIFGTIILFLLVNSFPPGFLSLVLGVSTYVLLVNVLKARQNRSKFSLRFAVARTLNEVLPVIVVSLLMIPVFSFFKTSQTSSHAYADMGFGIHLYVSYMLRIVKFLFYYHFLSILIFILTILLFLTKESEKLPFNRVVRKFVSDNRLLSFLLFVAIVYIPAVAFTPYMFDRYFIFLQPLISLLISYSLILFINEALDIKDKDKKANYIQIFIYGLFLLIGVNFVFKMQVISGRIYELTNNYLGPMDYIVRYISDNFKNPSKLKIDINIEQPVLMYYLGSSVICDDSSQCYSEPSDIILPRRGYIKDEFAVRVNRQMEMVKYQEVKLPVLDYPANNIPEFSLGLRHLFKTPTTNEPKDMIILYIKKG